MRKLLFNKTLSYRYLFGPVPSRRLGLSLGVDLIPHKTCSLDCIYCECGRTTDLTVDEVNQIPPGDIIKELDAFLGKSPLLDHITMAGSGEPTLYSGISRVIGHIKDNYPSYRVAVLTNGTLLWKKEVRAGLLRADVIIPSLDAVSPLAFNKIARPHSSLTPELIIDGMAALRGEYGGQVWLEIFLVPGVNDTDGEILLLKKAILRINPDKVQLNSLDRPGTENWVKKLDYRKMEDVAEMLGGAEIVASHPLHKTMGGSNEDIFNGLIAYLKRRPATFEDLAEGLNIEKLKLARYIDMLTQKNSITKKEQEGKVYYTAVR